jgi:hypothetical protein
MSAVPSPVSIFPILLHLCFICDIQAHADTAFATDHSYCDPVQVQDDIARIRLWQEQWNASTTPLFITESGADFAMRWNSTDSKGNPRGLPRPERDQGRAYAFANVAHQIENIAVGVDRTFAFNYLYHLPPLNIFRCCDS